MPRAPEPAEIWTASDVYLLTDGTQGRVALPHLELRCGPEGIELTKDDGGLVWHCAWGSLDVFSTMGESVLPDGGSGLLLSVVETGGRRHRFVVPTDQPSAVQAEVRARARAHRLQTFEPPAAVRRTLTVAVVVATVATVTVLMLSAAHILHF